MANLASVARPYALAAFEYAKEGRQLPAWKNFLEAASFIARQKEVVSLVENPELSREKLFSLFQEVLAAQLPVTPEQHNFLLLLSQNNRFSVLPEITKVFNAYYDALEKISRVRVVTAVAAPQEFQQKLSHALEKRIQHEVTLECETDPELIGGAVIHLGGDRVIDGSIRGKLTRLLESLTTRASLHAAGS